MHQDMGYNLPAVIAKPRGKGRKFDAGDNGQPATGAVYDVMQEAYQFFNRELFDGRLPDCVIVFNRKKMMHGHYHAGIWDARKGKATRDEISLNPDTFQRRTVRETLSTLVHEMVHQRQQHEGKPGRNGYHNAEWGSMMREIGLEPVNATDPNKPPTGQKVTHEIVRGGRYDVACKALLATGWRLEWLAKDTEVRKATRQKKAASKSKFTCPCCEVNAWGKPDLVILCGDCEERMIPA